MLCTWCSLIALKSEIFMNAYGFKLSSYMNGRRESTRQDMLEIAWDIQSPKKEVIQWVSVKFNVKITRDDVRGDGHYCKAIYTRSPSPREPLEMEWNETISQVIEAASFKLRESGTRQEYHWLFICYLGAGLFTFSRAKYMKAELDIFWQMIAIEQVVGVEFHRAQKCLYPHSTSQKPATRIWATKQLHWRNVLGWL